MADSLALTTILEGSAAARKRAVAALLAGDPTEARTVLLAVLDRRPKKAVRLLVAEALHRDADEAVARRLLEAPGIVVQPELLPPDVREGLFQLVRTELPRRPAKKALAMLAKVGIVPFEHRTRPSPGARALVLVVLDDPRLAARHASASHALAYVAPDDAVELLRQRWLAAPGVGVEGLLRWARLGCPPDAERVPALFEAFASGGVDALDDDLLAGAAPHVPDALVPRVLGSLGRAFPRFGDALVARLVEVEADLETRVAWLDARALERAHAALARSIAESGAVGAEAIVGRASRMETPTLARALAHLDPDVRFSLASGCVADPHWVAALALVPETLRDVRWLEAARATPRHGVSLLVAMARDLGGDLRREAVETLTSMAEPGFDRWILYALGQTGHPDATPPLVAALDHPDLGEAAPLVCTALGECGDTRALPVLRQRVRGRYGAFVRAAIEAIEARGAEIIAAVLLAAVGDADPALADLARRAREGDTDAAIVLEDALRERGRL